MIRDYLEGAFVTDVTEDDLLTAVKKRAGVEKHLLDLTGFTDLVRVETALEPGGQRGHWVLKVKVNLQVRLMYQGWSDKVCLGYESVYGYGNAAARL